MGIPVVWPLCAVAAFLSDTTPIFAQRRHLFRFELLCDLGRPQVADAHLEYPPDDCCRQLVHDPPVLILRAFV